MRGATGTHTEGRPDSDRSNYNPNTWTKPDLITLLPNPASSEVVVKLAPGMQSFRVLNAVGSLMVFQPASGAYQYLDVHNWPAGLYIVEGLGKDKIDNPRVKLIIE